MSDDPKLSAVDVLNRYMAEDLPEFVGMRLLDVDQVGLFGDRPIHVAAIRRDAAEVRALIEGGADVNAEGEQGHTPLHYAASRSIEIVRLLLEHGAGASLYRLNGMNHTALDLARMFHKDDIAALLSSLTRS